MGAKHVEEGLTAYGVPAPTETELRLMEVVPVFLRPTALAALVVFTTTLPKLTAAGETVVCALAKVVKIKQKIAVSDARIA
jgi:hypothetical protein